MNNETSHPFRLGAGFDPGADGKSMLTVAFDESGRVKRAGNFLLGDVWLRIRIGDAAAEPAAKVIEDERTGACSFNAVIEVEVLRDGEILTLTIPAPENVQLIEAVSPQASGDAEEAPKTLEELVLASMAVDARRVIAPPPVAGTADAMPLATAATSVVTPSEPETTVETIRQWPWENRDVSDQQFALRYRVGARSFNTPEAQAAWDQWYRQHSGEPGNACGRGLGSAVTDYQPFGGR